MRAHLLSVAVAITVLVGGSTAHSQEAARTGWWTLLSSGDLLPVPLVTPDLPAGGLFLQGGLTLDQPIAVAAMVLPAPAGVATRTLVLSATPSLLNTPGSAVLACPLLDTEFATARGGPIAQAPKYDCTSAVPVLAGADGRSFTFDSRPLLRDGVVAAALVPGSALTRVAFEAPGPRSLRARRAPPVDDGPATTAPSVTPEGAPAGPPAPPVRPALALVTGGESEERQPQPSGPLAPIPVLNAIESPTAAGGAVALAVAGVLVARLAWRRAGFWSEVELVPVRPHRGGRPAPTSKWQ